MNVSQSLSNTSIKQLAMNLANFAIPSADNERINNHFTSWQLLKFSFLNFIKIQRSKSKSYKKEAKIILDTEIVQEALFNFVQEFEKAKISKLGYSKSQNHIYFWIEVPNNGKENEKHIENLIKTFNEENSFLPLTINYILVTDDLNFEVPSDYGSIKLDL